VFIRKVFGGEKFLASENGGQGFLAQGVFGGFLAQGIFGRFLGYT
jgi:hypothetical protein